MSNESKPVFIRGLSPKAYRWLQSEAGRLRKTTGLPVSLAAVARLAIEEAAKKGRT